MQLGDIGLEQWLVAYVAAILSLLIATAMGKSGLSRKMEHVVARYLPTRSHRLIIRYAALLLTGLFATAYTIFFTKPSSSQSIFATALTSAFAIELFPGTSQESKPGARNQT